MSNDWLAKARAEGRILEHGVNLAVFQESPGNGVVLSEQLDMMSENQFQAEVCRLAHEHGWKIAHFRKVRVQRRDGSVHWETPVAEDGKGFPDLLLIRRGCRPVYAELKVKRNVPTEEQWEWIHDLRATGAKAVVWYPSDWQEIVETLTLSHGHSEAAGIAQELHRLADDGCRHADDEEAA